MGEASIGLPGFVLGGPFPCPEVAVAAESKPPATIRVGPHVIKVSVDKKRANDASLAFAHFDRIMSEIVVAPDQSATQMRDSVLHETLHAICENVSAQAGGDTAIFRDDDHEERLVRPFATALLGVLRDNRELISYLTQP